jgi:hypothetical protein
MLHRVFVECSFLRYAVHNNLNNIANLSSRIMALGSTQPLTTMSTRNIPGGKRLPARKADNLTAICGLIVYKHVEASTSHNPMGYHSLLQG